MLKWCSWYSKWKSQNLSDDTIAKVNEVIDAIKADKIEVKTEL